MNRDGTTTLYVRIPAQLHEDIKRAAQDQPFGEQESIKDYVTRVLTERTMRDISEIESRRQHSQGG